MSNEMFPPTEEELADMIREVQQQMEEAESRLEYDELSARLYELERQQQELIIKNNAL